MNNQSNSAASEGASMNFFGPAFAENPFPAFTQMRAAGAVVPIPAPFVGGEQQVWLVTRLEEAVQVLKDRQFTVDMSTINEESASQQAMHGPGHLLGQSMISVDEPDHRRLRGLVSKAFTPKYIQSLRPGIQQIADDLLDQLQAQGHMDLVNDYAFPLPITVISDMLGVPAQNREIIREWSDTLTGAVDMGQRRDRRDRTQIFTDYLVQLIAEKRQHPQDDLISQLVQIEEAGDRLDEGELLSMIALLIFAGHETTSNLVGIGTLMLLDHPDQMERLKQDLSLVPSAVEELLRYNGPVLSPAPRFATADVTLAGQQIHKGDVILVVLGSANRDESQFTHPDELEIARGLNRHIAFGQGIHICLGAPLARLEGDIAFTTLLRRMPNLQLAIPRSDVTWRGSFNLRGIKSLPVTF
ncbi:MAG: cytochrome P450 [Ktedonobacteraceae bacterium]|nr:cytochrome P450 [Ktedonobacteraceae bacterium]